MKKFANEMSIKKQPNINTLVYTKFKKHIFVSIAMKSFNQNICFQSVNDTTGEHISKQNIVNKHTLDM